jgi:hypothetical protein
VKLQSDTTRNSKKKRKQDETNTKKQTKIHTKPSSSISSGLATRITLLPAGKHNQQYGRDCVTWVRTRNQNKNGVTTPRQTDAKHHPELDSGTNQKNKKGRLT